MRTSDEKKLFSTVRDEWDSVVWFSLVSCWAETWRRRGKDACSGSGHSRGARHGYVLEIEERVRGDVRSMRVGR